MSVIIRLQNLPWSANASDVRSFFRGLGIPDGGVHIVGGENGDAFIAFSTDEDARQAMMLDGGKVKETQVRLLLSSRAEMQKVIETARQATISFMNYSATATGTAVPPVVPVHPQPKITIEAPVQVPQPPIITSNSLSGILAQQQQHQTILTKPPIAIAKPQPPIITTNSLSGILAQQMYQQHQLQMLTQQQNMPAMTSTSVRHDNAYNKTHQIGHINPMVNTNMSNMMANNYVTKPQFGIDDATSGGRMVDNLLQRTLSKTTRSRSKSRERRDRRRSRSRDRGSRYRDRSRSRDRRHKRRNRSRDRSSDRSRDRSRGRDRDMDRNRSDRSYERDNRNKRDRSASVQNSDAKPSAMPFSNIQPFDNMTLLPPSIQQFDQSAIPAFSSNFAAALNNNNINNIPTQRPMINQMNPIVSNNFNNNSCCCIRISNIEKNQHYSNIRKFFGGLQIPNDGIKILNNEMGERRGEAVVRFTRHDVALHALQKNQTLFGNNIVKVVPISDAEYVNEIDLYKPPRHYQFNDDRMNKNYDYNNRFDRNNDNKKDFGSSSRNDRRNNSNFNKNKNDYVNNVDDDDERREMMDDGDDDDIMFVSDSNTNNFTTLLIEDLPNLTTEQDIMKMFSDFSLVHILLAKIPKHHHAYAKFHSAVDTQAALQETHKHRINFRTVRVKTCSDAVYEKAKEEFGNLDFNKEDVENNEASTLMDDDMVESDTAENEEDYRGSGYDDHTSNNENIGTNNINQFQNNMENQTQPKSNIPSLIDLNFDSIPSLDSPNSSNPSTTIGLPNVILADPRLRRQQQQQPQMEQPMQLFSNSNDGFSRNNFSGNNGQTNIRQSQMNRPKTDGPSLNDLNCILIKNLEFRTLDKDITDWFSEIGIIPDSIHLMLNKRGQPSGDCFCEFNSIDDARKSISKNRTRFRGRTVNINLVEKGHLMNVLNSFNNGPNLFQNNQQQNNQKNEQNYCEDENNDDDDTVQGVEDSKIQNENNENDNNDEENCDGDDGDEDINDEQGDNDNNDDDCDDDEQPKNVNNPFSNKGSGGGGGFAAGNDSRIMNNDPRGNHQNNRFPSLLGNNQTQNMMMGGGGMRNNNNIQPRNNGGLDGRVVGMRNVPYNANIGDVLSFFDGFNIGPDDVIRRYNDNGTVTGDARVCFSSPMEARVAVERKNRTKMMNRSILLSIV